MKEVYKSAGLKVADYIKLDTLDEALEFTKKNGYPVIVKPDNGVGATHTYKLKDDEELKELLMYSTLETLGDDYKRLEISRQFMKNETKKLSERVEAFLGR